jgi:hypothetical protein
VHSFLGLDEAGYGPNLGPLVVSCTRWKLPSAAANYDFYAALGDVVSAESDCKGTRLHIADSKVVYSPARGIGSLETSALAILAQLDRPVRTLHGLWVAVAGCTTDGSEPWFADDVELPLRADRSQIADLAGRFCDVLKQAGAALTGIGSDIVQTARFNRLTLHHDSKGAALSNITLELLARYWSPSETGNCLIVLDKHGGRNKYDNLLLSNFPDIFPQCLEEGRERSRYRIGPHECRFQMKAEANLPVAAASIISKYVREVTMEAFNRFWLQHDPTLRPTKGYPGDADRFRQDVQHLRARLKISDDVFWRCR